MVLSYKTILLLGMMVFVYYASAEQHHDSHFETVHQHEWAVHQTDNVLRNTPVESKEIKTDSIDDESNQIRTIINSSLLIVMVLILIVVITIFLMLRRVYKVGKE